MKKIRLFVLLMVINSLSAKAQDINTIFGDDVVWYGLDFSMAKFVGSFDNVTVVGPPIKNTGSDLKLKYIPGWNILILKEPYKFTIKDSFRKKTVFNQTGAVGGRNSKIDENEIIVHDNYKFDNEKETVSQMLSEYVVGEKKEGLGLVFIVESFNKIENTATIYVTFFDIATKKVLLMEKFVEEPSGIGLKNYWAGAIYKIFREVENRKMKEWESKYKQK